MAMAVIHLARPAFLPSPSLRPRGQRVLRLRVRCRVGGDEGDGGRGSDEDAPESLFAKELRRRGMSAGSVPSGENAGATAEAEEGGPGGEARRKRVVGAAAAEFQRAAAVVDGQRERSMALNSEGLEGLVPRAKVLVSLGGTFFLAFGPLIIVTVSLFAGLHLTLVPTKDTRRKEDSTKKKPRRTSTTALHKTMKRSTWKMDPRTVTTTRIISHRQHCL